MKKIGFIILLTLSFLLLTNCNKNENKNPKIKFSDDTYKLFEEFTENKKDIIKKLKTLNKEEANRLYEKYVEDNENILYKIAQESEKFLESIYYGSAEEQFTEKDWNDTNKILNKYDLELWDVGEGMVTIRELPHLYYDIFKDYVTDDYKEYLKIWAKDDEELYQADAGLCITFEELGDRIARWENFLNKFPNSTLKSKVTALLNSYREDYILGMDNTPTIDGGYDNVPITIYEEAKKEYDRFMKKYPNSPTVELIKYFLKNYQNKNIHELIRCKIIEKFEKDPFVDVFSETLGKMIVIQGNYLKYILGEKDWNVNITDGYIYSGEEKYPIQILGTSILNSDETSTWVWAWKNSDIFNGDLLSLIYNVHGLGMDLKLCTFINSELKITDEVNGSILSTIACGILSENLAFDKIAYTEAGGVVFYAVKDLPNKVFSSSVDAGVFMDITLNCINLYNLNHKLFIESFLKQNKTKYKWQGDTIIADFEKDGELKIDFEKVEDKLVLKEINFNEVK
nr:DUF6882 domain-containing protein [Fusobacterium nucleatum]